MYLRKVKAFFLLTRALLTFAFQTLAKNHVVGIILAGGPHSVYENGAPHVHEGVSKGTHPSPYPPVAMLSPLAT